MNTFSTQKQIENAIDNCIQVVCDQGEVIKGKGDYYIKAPNGHLVGLGTEQYGLNGSNFRTKLTFFPNPHHSEFLERPCNRDIYNLIQMWGGINNFDELRVVARREHRFDICDRVNRFLGVFK